MTKLEKVWLVSLVIAMAGVVGFWFFGFRGNMDASAFSLFVLGGVGATVALCALGLQKLRTGSCYF